MSTSNFPGSLDNSSTLPNPTAGSKTNSPSLSALCTTENDAIKALETKVGTGTGTSPAANKVLLGTGSGTSDWSGLTSSQLASVLSDGTGSGSAVFNNTPTLITPKADTINENTTDNGVTVDGLNIKDGVLNSANSVTASNLQANTVNSTNVDWSVNGGMGWQQIANATSGTTAANKFVSFPKMNCLEIRGTLTKDTTADYISFNLQNSTGTGYNSRRYALNIDGTTPTSFHDSTYGINAEGASVPASGVIFFRISLVADPSSSGFYLGEVFAGTLGQFRHDFVIYQSVTDTTLRANFVAATGNITASRIMVLGHN